MTGAGSRDAIGGGATATLFDCDAPGVDRFHFEGFVSDADLNALLPDEGYETLSKPEKKNAAVTDSDLDALLPDEGYEKKDAQPKG